MAIHHNEEISLVICGLRSVVPSSNQGFWPITCLNYAANMLFVFFWFFPTVVESLQPKKENPIFTLLATSDRTHLFVALLPVVFNLIHLQRDTFLLTQTRRRSATRLTASEAHTPERFRANAYTSAFELSLGRRGDRKYLIRAAYGEDRRVNTAAFLVTVSVI